MTKTLNRAGWKRLDAELKRVDEDRWLSSRYASQSSRKALIALYMFVHELARVRLVVSEQMLGAIRFEWWREALDKTAADYPRRHDVVQALAECSAAGLLDTVSLWRLIDQFERAFEAGDRAPEPDDQVASMAAQVLATAHGWNQPLREVALHYAALKRGEDVGSGAVVAKAPSGIRPAIAHFRLRWPLGQGKSLSRFDRRASIFQAIFTGRI